MTKQPSRISIAAFDAVMRDHLPLAAAWGVETVEIYQGSAILRIGYRDDFVRPGGTINGPVQMALADVAVYAALLGSIWPSHDAVTSNLSINFLRRPKPGGLTAHAQILKLGRRLAVGEVALFSDHDPEMVAHVVATYAIPNSSKNLQ